MFPSPGTVGCLPESPDKQREGCGGGAGWAGAVGLPVPRAAESTWSVRREGLELLPRMSLLGKGISGRFTGDCVQDWPVGVCERGGFSLMSFPLSLMVMAFPLLSLSINHNQFNKSAVNYPASRWPRSPLSPFSVPSLPLGFFQLCIPLSKWKQNARNESTNGPI